MIHWTYANALVAGATPVYAPTDDHPSGDRWGEAKDPFGNTWYIATRKGWIPGPEGFLTVQPYLHLRDAHNMIPFMLPLTSIPLALKKSTVRSGRRHQRRERQ